MLLSPILSLSLILFTSFRIRTISRIFQKILGAHNTIRILPWTKSTPSFIILESFVYSRT